ncbi:MAG: potassium channel family protein [Bacteroidota bacterium]|nr:potassium channel family protein [Bacteroidota bacterium]
MKVYRYIQNYQVEILNDTLTTVNGIKHKQSAKISFFDINNNLIERKEYGVVDVKSLYQKIKDKTTIDVSNCLVRGFSLSEYRSKFNLNQNEKIDLIDFCANDALFESEKVVDFSLANFTGTKADFTNAHFGSGNLSFLKAEFGNFPVSFKGTSYSEGNNIFQYAKFNSGKVNFDNATFENGNLSFINTYFGDGNVSFKNVHFGNGDVSFAFATFKKGSVIFDKSIFNGDEINFSKVDFGNGKVDFRRVHFGDGEINFKEINVSEGNKLIFRRTEFGSSNVSFREGLLTNCVLDFEEATFNNARLDFYKLSAQKISLNHCLLNCYIDLRIDLCHTIDLSQSIVQNIIDLNPGLTKMKIDELNLTGVRNMGDIFISWDDNRVLDLIECQTNTNFHEKAEQFRLLKEEFRDTGRYLDEDKAYVYFKRYELKDQFEQAKSKGTLQTLLFIPNFLFQRIVFDWIGLYATNPFRVLFSIVIVNFIFSGIYSLLYSSVNYLTCLVSFNGLSEKVWTNLYFSAITFFTVGYGDCSPMGYFKIIAPIEGFIGVFLMTYFTVAFVRKILR